MMTSSSSSLISLTSSLFTALGPLYTRYTQAAPLSLRIRTLASKYSWKIVIVIIVYKTKYFRLHLSYKELKELKERADLKET